MLMSFFYVCWMHAYMFFVEKIGEETNGVYENFTDG
jgi:hypothetical protein